MTRVIAILFLASVVLASCVTPARLKYMPEPIPYPTTEGFTEMMESWEEADAEQLLKQWGVPESTFSSGSGTEVWIYNWDESYRTPITTVTTTTSGTATSKVNSFTGQVTTTFQPGTSTTRSYGGALVEVYCRVQVYIKGGRVDYWKWDGNTCKKVPSPKPVDCLKYGGELRIVKIGRYSRDEPLGSAVKLSNGRVFRLSKENDIDRAGFWKPVRGKGKPVLACLNSGIGQYLITYPTVMGLYTNSKVFLLEGKFTR